jgi:hypothetical protein
MKQARARKPAVVRALSEREFAPSEGGGGQGVETLRGGQGVETLSHQVVSPRD